MTREGRELWAKRVERWQDSGLTSTEFAAEVGINPKTLVYWKWRLSHPDAKRAPRRRPPRRRQPDPQFVEVVPSPPPRIVSTVTAPTIVAEPPPSRSVPMSITEDEPLEVILHDGVRIRVPARFNGDALRRVVAALAGAR